MHVLPRRPRARLGLKFASRAAGLRDSRPSAQFWAIAATRKRLPNTMQDEPPAVFGDNTNVDPALLFDQLSPTDVVNIPISVCEVVLAVVIQAHHRLVIPMSIRAVLNPSLTMICVLGAVILRR